MAQNNKANKNKPPKQQQQQQSKKNVQQKQKQSAQASNQVNKCSSCRWLMGSFMLIVILGAVIAYDTEYNGKGVFAKSVTGKLLQNAGVLPYVEKGWYTTMSACARTYKWAELHVPPYARPVVNLGCDLFKLARNVFCNAFIAISDLFKAKLPVAANFLEQYAPGLPKKIGSVATATGDMFANVWQSTTNFFKTQVFVGNLSPDNLSLTLNRTQTMAIKYYNMFSRKVDAYAKLT